MKRLALPLTLAALLAGCGQLPFFGPQSGQPAEVVPDTLELHETTQVVREIHEVPVYYVDTVYVEEEPAPAETVLVVEEYETLVMVPGQPPHPRRPRQRWSPGLPGPPRREQPEREPGQRGQRPDNPDSQPPPRGQREPKPQPQPPPDATEAEEPQPPDDPGTGSTPVDVAELELPVIISPPSEPVVPVAFTPPAPPVPVRTERPAPSSNVEAEAPTQPSEDKGLTVEQSAVRGERPARGQRPTSDEAKSEDAGQVADNG